MLKKAMSEAPLLQVPDFEKDFVLATDASDIAVSAVLNQRVNGELAPVAYYSRLLSLAERRYSTYEKECLAVVFGCEKARTYLEHKEFELHCNNLALCWLFRNVKKVGHQFFLPQLKNEVFQCVKQCDLCQCAKCTQNMRVELHSATPASCPLERTKFWTEAIRNLRMAKNRVAKRFNVGRKEAQYKVGDTVLCQRKVLSSKGKGISQKLELKWSVPMVIVRFLEPNVVQLTMPESGVIEKHMYPSLNHITKRVWVDGIHM